MSQTSCWTLGIALVLTSIGCSSSDSDMASGEMGAPSGASSPGGSSSNGGTETPEPGQMTAGDWDDNLNFDIFRSYMTEYDTSKQGPFLRSADRVVVQVTAENGEPLSNAGVRIELDDTVLLEAPTASDGRLLFFPGHDGASDRSEVRVTVLPPPSRPGTATTFEAPEGDEWVFTLPESQRQNPTGLDLAFVVDTTGSMSDELSYLNAEIDSIAGMVHEAAPSVGIRYALVVYRDAGDEYVTRSFDFTDALDDFKQVVGQQGADGGGDFEEAVHRGVGDMNQLSWRTGNVARVGFVIGDAPPHADEVSALLEEADRARKQGVKLYPVAASGTDRAFEHQMRQAAQWTLGRYLFITDDSGIGDSHLEPLIPCYYVQHLNTLMTRLILSELEGRYIPPDPSDVVREAGSPEDGICTLDDGTKARIF